MRKVLLTLAALAALGYSMSSETQAIKQVPRLEDSISQAVRDPKRSMLPVIGFHRVKEKPSAYTHISPARTREVFDYLHKNGFYLTPLEDVVQKKIQIPSNKKPVVLTWDDNLLNPLFVKEYIAFTRANPDFGRAATVFVSTPNKYLGLKKDRLKQIIDFYETYNIDIQPHGTHHAYLDNASREEAEKEALPIVSKMKLLSLNPQYYAFPGGSAPNLKETRKFFEDSFSALILSNGGLHDINKKTEYIKRTDVIHFDYLKTLLKNKDKRLYVQP